ncbi:tetratricopeptide repeat protein [Pigmentiphaga litoralis]|uniref:tetratricopeptide repeat protein n=1 Tax=Pigmentiphaga litoralis TaxID=516702 RepID=UPI003B4288E0
MQEALLFDPSDPWLRLTLARLYLKTGAIDDARGLVDGLLVSHPDMPDALHASALIDADTREWQRASASLERIPAARRNAAITALQRRVTVHLLTGNASALGRQRRAQEAYTQLAQAESIAGNDSELIGAVASSYADLGDAPRAVGVMRQLMARSVNNRNVDVQLAYAGLLLRTRQDVELAGILRQLQPQTMTSAQMQSFQDIRNVYTIRQADVLRGRGDLVGAYDVIKPVLAYRPDDAAALAALARMYADSGNGAKAQELYTRVLRDAPDRVEALLGAASAAAMAKDTALADTMLERALKVAPADQDVLATAARIYTSQGRTARAEQMLKAAIALQTLPAVPTQPALAEMAVPMAEIDDNPFARPGAVRPLGPSQPLSAVTLSAGPAVAGRLPGQAAGRPVADYVGAALSAPLMDEASTPPRARRLASCSMNASSRPSLLCRSTRGPATAACRISCPRSSSSAVRAPTWVQACAPAKAKTA